MADKGGSYRDTVREMMGEMAAAKKAESSSSKNVTETEEDLLDDILDLEEGGEAAGNFDEKEAEALLKSDDDDDTNADSGTKDKEDTVAGVVPEVAAEKTSEIEDIDMLDENDDEEEKENRETPSQPTDNVGTEDGDTADGVEAVELSEEDDDENSNKNTEDTTKDNEESEPAGESKKDAPKTATDQGDDGNKSAEKDNEQSGNGKADYDSDSIQMIEEIEDSKDSSSSSKNEAIATDIDKSKEEVADGEKKKKAKSESPEVVELSSNEDDSSDSDEDDDESESSSSEEDEGDPSKPPGEGASKPIQEEYLQPFLYGWKREVVLRHRDKGSIAQCDIYYLPPQDGRYRTREAKRKRRSKADQERYFDDFPDEVLTISNFNYVRKPLGLENAAYEIIRRAAMAETDHVSGGKKCMTEVKESTGLLDIDSDDSEIMMINGFDFDMPVSLQADRHVLGMQNEFKKRRKYRDPETCCTPPMVEDQLWTAMDDDPFGVYTDLGGRSEPATPPPLRAVGLTTHASVKKIQEAFEAVRKEAFKEDPTKAIDLEDELASHDAAIRKFKHMKISMMELSKYRYPR